jgi:SAM-dependent methyltransferase
MSRNERILGGITKDMRGIEIAPWFAPLAPKSQGFNCLTLDIFDCETLARRAENDPNIPKESIGAIECVDLVGSATEIAALVPTRDHGAFDYVVSSHNFEHLPNPIKFLQGCQTVLRTGGVVSMAVPDARACFDFFRPHTTVVDWLRAFRDDLAKPSADQLFQFRAHISTLRQDDRNLHAFSVDSDLARVAIVGDLEGAYRDWLTANEADPYVDAHCTVMTPASFELLIVECRHLGLTSFECASVSAPVGCEFYVRLINRPEARPSDDINAIRTRLAHRIWSERAQTATSADKRDSPPPIAAPPQSAVSPQEPVRAPEISLRKALSRKLVHPLKRRLRRLQGREG